MSFLQPKPPPAAANQSFLSTLYTSIRPHHLLALYTACQYYLKNSTLYKKIRCSIIELLSSTTNVFLPAVYAGYVPDVLIRYGIRLQLKDRITSLEGSNVEEYMNEQMEIIEKLASSPIAIETGAANEQHYEVPAEFYDLCLGPRKKYSSGLWPKKNTTFAESEVEMLALYCQRAGVVDGMKVVDLGCGWGSLTLYLLEHYPNIKVTSISNSYSQREYILHYVETKLPADRMKNVSVITCNVADDSSGAMDCILDQDLVCSIEMFEHMKNYSRLLAKVHTFLKAKGKVFLHIFTHKSFTYHFDDEGWMSQHFFTGGTMPSNDLMLYFSQNFSIEKHWVVNGQNYEKTSNAWLQTLDHSWKTEHEKLMGIFKNTYGEGNEQEWYWKWRCFFMACAELWGYDSGEEWVVSHYLFERR